MIKFERLEFKNFLSYGNMSEVYNFENGITSIIGINGVGKSVISDALCYVLFNSSYRDVKLAKLVNFKNKMNLEVILYFSKNDEKYYVRRTMKSKTESDFFGYYKMIDGIWTIEPLLPNKNNYQKQFEENVIGMDKYYFELVVTKSALPEKYISFISLSKKERIEFMDTVFNIKIFDYIAEENKEDLARIKQKLEISNNSYNIYTKLLEEQKTKLDIVEQNRKNNISDKIKEHEENIEKIKIEIDKLVKAKNFIDGKKSKINNISRVLWGLNENKKQYENKNLENNTYIKVINDKNKMFDSMCGSCEVLKKIKKLDNIDNIIEDIKNNNEKIANIDADILQHEKEIEECKEFTIKESAINSLLHKEVDLRDQKLYTISELKKELFIEQDVSDIIDTENKIKESHEQICEIREEEKYEEIIKKLINPLKFYIVKRWIPYFNQIVNEYLFKFGLPMNIIFDEKFEETISFKNRMEIDYGGLSNGQRKRIDLSIMFALSDLSKKIKNQSYNLLMLDEVEDGLDKVGLDLFLEILKEKSRDMEIIIITHKVNIEESNLNRKLIVENVGGFSKIT